MVWSFCGTIILVSSSFTVKLLFVAYQQQTVQFAVCHAQKAHLSFRFHWNKWKQLHLGSACQKLAGDCSPPSEVIPKNREAKMRFSGHSLTLQVIWTTSTFNGTRNRPSVWQGERGESQAQNSNKLHSKAELTSIKTKLRHILTQSLNLLWKQQGQTKSVAARF